LLTSIKEQPACPALPIQPKLSAWIGGRCAETSRHASPASALAEDRLLDHRLLKNGGDDLQFAAAVRSGLEIDLESEASAMTDLYSSCVAAKTRLSNLVQLSRTGR
jgi:hypothetical protein